MEPLRLRLGLVDLPMERAQRLVAVGVTLLLLVPAFGAQLEEPPVLADQALQRLPE